MTIINTSLNKSTHPLDIANEMQKQNGQLGIDKKGNIAFYSGIHIFLHPQICKSGSDFVKNMSKHNNASMTVPEKNRNQNPAELKNKTELRNRLQSLSNELENSNKFLKGKDVKTARFRDMPTAHATQVISPDGLALAANRIRINGTNVAIASQYPRDRDLSSYFKMLVENRTPALVILASETEVAGTPGKIPGKSSLPAYFREAKEYPDNITVKVKDNATVTPLGSIKIEQHTLNVHVRVPGEKGRIDIPVIHVTNWPDKEALSAEDTKKLVNYVNDVKNKRTEYYHNVRSKAVGDANKLLPVIHCRAGVGRTGQLIAATALMDLESKCSLESVVTDMRQSRNHKMVQTDTQLDQLVILANKLGRPLLKDKPVDIPVPSAKSVRVKEQGISVSQNSLNSVLSAQSANVKKETQSTNSQPITASESNIEKLKRQLVNNGLKV